MASDDATLDATFEMWHRSRVEVDATLDATLDATFEMWHRSRVEVDATLDATLGNVASFKG